MRKIKEFCVVLFSASYFQKIKKNRKEYREKVLLILLRGLMAEYCANRSDCTYVLFFTLFGYVETTTFIIVSMLFP